MSVSSEESVDILLSWKAMSIFGSTRNSTWIILTILTDNSGQGYSGILIWMLCSWWLIDRCTFDTFSTIGCTYLVATSLQTLVHCLHDLFLIHLNKNLKLGCHNSAYLLNQSFWSFDPVMGLPYQVPCHFAHSLVRFPLLLESIQTSLELL